jgi:anaerobic selenocysteine-containing dehydrogenase
MSIAVTACPLCSRNCGLEVEIQDGKFIKIKGDEKHPISEGYICQKAARLEYYQNHDDRLKYPLNRPKRNCNTTQSTEKTTWR